MREGVCEGVQGLQGFIQEFFARGEDDGWGSHFSQIEMKVGGGGGGDIPGSPCTKTLVSNNTTLDSLSQHSSITYKCSCNPPLFSSSPLLPSLCCLVFL